MRNYTGELRGILEIYAEEIEAARKKRKPTSGLLGFGPKPSDDPCHEKVDESVKALLEQLAEESDAELTGQVVSDLFHAEAERAWPTDAGLMPCKGIHCRCCRRFPRKSDRSCMPGMSSGIRGTSGFRCRRRSLNC